MMENLHELKKSIFANGMIEEADIKRLQETIFDEEGITKAKADFLFELKDTISNRKITLQFQNWFIETISAFLLEDEDSPGEIDESEARWLRAKMQRNGSFSKLDKKLLANLRKKSINFPEMLNYKNKPVRWFEAMLFSLRFITFLAVLGSMFASIALFIRSSRCTRV
jgi:hypothetical protein